MSYEGLGFDLNTGVSIPGITSGTKTDSTYTKSSPTILSLKESYRPTVGLTVKLPGIEAARESEIERQRDADHDLPVEDRVDEWVLVDGLPPAPDPVPQEPGEKNVPWLWIGLGVTGVVGLGAFLFWRSK